MPEFRSTEQTITSNAIGTGSSTPKAVAPRKSATAGSTACALEAWVRTSHGTISASTAPATPARSMSGSATTLTRHRLRGK